MAKILICVPALVGHINPVRAVASHLRQRGHELAWAIPGAGALAPQFGLDAGETVFALPAAMSTDLAQGPRLVRGLESVRFFYEEYCLPLAAAVHPALLAVARDFQPTLMLCDQQMPAGGIVARQLGIPWLTSVTTSASILRHAPMLDAWLEQRLHTLQETCGAVPVTRPDLAPAGAIVFSSEQLIGDTQPRLDVICHFVGPAFTDRGDAIDFPWQRLRPDQRRVLVTLGTVSRDRDIRFFDVMLEALGGLNMEVIMVAPAELAQRAPTNVIVRERVPQIELLPVMDAVICHAGHNTVCEALTFGLPLLVAPIRDDQPVIARQVIEAGAALPLRFGKLTPAVARERLLQLLGNPGYADNARRLGASFRSLGGARRAADLLEALVPMPTGVLQCVS